MSVPYVQRLCQIQLLLTYTVILTTGPIAHIQFVSRKDFIHPSLTHSLLITNSIKPATAAYTLDRFKINLCVARMKMELCF